MPVLIWLGIIALESSDLGSSEHTGALFLRLWTAVLGPPNPDTFEAFHHLIRKSGHFIGYAILSVLVFRALRGSSRLRQKLLATSREYFWQLRWAAWAIAATLLTGALDEIHQSFDAARTSRWQDVLIDTSGALVIQVILYFLVTPRNSDARLPQAGA